MKTLTIRRRIEAITQKDGNPQDKVDKLKQLGDREIKKTLSLADAGHRVKKQNVIKELIYREKTKNNPRGTER